MYLLLVTWLAGFRSRALLLPALHPWRVPCRRVSGDGMRVEPSLMHPEGGSWTEVRTHTPIKCSKVLSEPLAPIPLDRSKFRENGSQPPPNLSWREQVGAVARPPAGRHPAGVEGGRPGALDRGRAEAAAASCRCGQVRRRGRGLPWPWLASEQPLVREAKVCGGAIPENEVIQEGDAEQLPRVH